MKHGFKPTSARFSAVSEKSATVTFEYTGELPENKEFRIRDGEVPIASATAAPHPCVKKTAVAEFDLFDTSAFDITRDYMLEAGGGSVRIVKSAFIDSPAFMSEYESEKTLGLEYGAIYSKDKTIVRLWAPFARAAEVKLYKSGAAPFAYKTVAMLPRGGGVWETELVGDFAGVYYTFNVFNYRTPVETIDQFAKACNTNGTRGMIVDLRSTDPRGWEHDAYIHKTSPLAADTPVVWEIHVGDFSASPDSGMRYKSKYLAFTEDGTYVPGDRSLKTGIAYLKDLGVTYVQLNPVFDFATVDEGDMSGADRTKDNFNWGYDPQNYFIPEGSYSTDPSRGEVRITEFKRMVQALHGAGIGVIMDAVYNHTYATGGQALHDTAPYYYHRTDGSGNFTDGSGCGNETATERAFVRKYVIDSVLYWAKEYHIDGFRLDLMGLHDLVTVRELRAALDKISPSLLLYGEPWAADGYYMPKSFAERIECSGETDNKLIKLCDINALPKRVAVFNDCARDALRGNNEPGRGWAQGGGGENVAAMLCGNAKGADCGSRSVVYASAHDNYTLWDQLVGKKAGTETPLFYEYPININLKRNAVVAAAYLMSPGICFMLAGEEFGRTKYGNDNSYNSPQKLNRLEWTRQAEFAPLVDVYKKLVAVRKKHSHELFSYAASADPQFTRGEFNCDGTRVWGKRGALEAVYDTDPDSPDFKIKIGADEAKLGDCM